MNLKQLKQIIAEEIQNVMNEAEDEIISIKVKDGEYTDTWYMKKIDSTHFWRANNAAALKRDQPLGAAVHTDSLRRSYPKTHADIRSWLKGGKSPNGKTYSEG